MAIQFGRYQLLKKLASGGMGQVFLARTGQEGFEKLVVLKRLLPHLVEDEEFFTMFQDEAKITMRLNHPNIAQIFEFGEERGIHYLVMEYIAGEDIRRLTKRVAAAGQNLPLGVILRVIADAAAGLDYAHKGRDSKGVPLGLVHRDVSPQNVLVGFDGAVKLIDFGVAKAAGRAQHTATGMGKFPYMSPEQAEGLDIDLRSDVFALGIVLWELLTNKRLFKGDSDVMTQRLVKLCQVPPPSQVDSTLPVDLDALVLKALAKNPEDRYPDAGAFRLALEEFAMKNSIPASSAHLVAFLQPFYADRINLEANASSLDDLTSETELDWNGSAKTAAPTASPAPELVARTQTGKGTQALPAKKPARGMWLGLGGAAVVAVAVLAYFTRGREVTPVTVGPPVEQAEPVKPLPVVELEKLTFQIVSEPPGADVELAGKRVGSTPLALAYAKSELPLQLRVSHEGFEPRDLNLTASSERQLSAQLVKRKAKPVANKPPEIKTNR
jgi:eukaryotic-like serine/threonine-protein kinase